MKLRRRDISLTLALSASLLGHGAIVWWALDSRVNELLWELSYWGRTTYAQRETKRLTGKMPETSGLIVPQPEREPEREREVIKEPPPPPADVRRRQQEPPPEAPRIGDSAGGGEAASRSPGEKPQEAREFEQAQPNLGLMPQGSRRSGGGGAGGTPGTPSEAGRPGAEQVPQARRGSEGLMKEGSGEVSPPLGVRPEIAPAPKVEPRALPPAVEERRRAIEKAREAEALREAKGRTPEAKAAESRDDRGNATKADERPVGEREERERNQAAGKAERAGTPSAAEVPGVGLATPSRAGEEARRRDPAREGAPSSDATSPRGEPGGDATRSREGVKEKPPEAGEEKLKPEASRETPPETRERETREAEAQKAAERRSEAAGQASAAAAAAAAQQAQPQATPNAPTPGQGSTGGQGDGRAPGDPLPPGDTALQSDTELSATMKVGSVRFAQGKVEARFGRRFRSVAPRLTLAGQMDIATKGRSAVVLAVTIDATGNVTKVEVLESSGSPDSVDLPVVRAVYGWWIEPLKDRKGDPIGDTMVWRIVLGR